MSGQEDTKVPYSAAEIYEELSLDAKARLAVRAFVRKHNACPTGGQVAIALAEIDPRDTIDAGAASRAAAECRRVQEVERLTKRQSVR